jgi:hypothetical protein
MRHASVNGMHRMYFDRSKPDSVQLCGTLAALPHLSAAHNAGRSNSALDYFGSF